MRYLSNNNKSNVNTTKFNKFLSTVSSSIVLSAFAVSVLFSASTMADDTAGVKKANSMQVSQQKSTKSHSFTIDKQQPHKMASEDGKIGSYSLSDGARRGAYGDGVYSNAD